MSDEEIEREAVEELIQEAKKAEAENLPAPPPICINKTRLCPSLVSTLRNPILPRKISKRKHVGLADTNFDTDEPKRPNDGQEYDPAGDYIYDARRYFNPEKYREIVANGEQKKKRQCEQYKFYYKPQLFCGHRRHQFNSHAAATGNVCLSPEYGDTGWDRLSVLEDEAASRYPICPVDDLQYALTPASNHHEKPKKRKSKHSRRDRHSCGHRKRKKSDKKKHKKKHNRKKSNDLCRDPVASNCGLSREHRKAKFQNRSKSLSSQHSRSSAAVATNHYNSYDSLYTCDTNVGNSGGASDPHFLRGTSDQRFSPINRMTAAYSAESPCEENSELSDNFGPYSGSDTESFSPADRPDVVRDTRDGPNNWDEDLATKDSVANGNYSPGHDRQDFFTSGNISDLISTAVGRLYCPPS